MDNTKDKRGRVTGRKLLVTGGASGLGAATCRLLAAEGAKVAVLDRNAEGAEMMAREVGGYAHAVDLSTAEAIGPAVDAAANAMDGIDGVVNVAGIAISRPFAETDLASLNAVININLIAPFLLCQAALPYLKAVPGSTIVNIGTGAALYPLANRSAYGASKGGVIALTKILALELAPDIRVNVVCPGAIDTPMVRLQFTTAEQMERVVSRYALKRMAQAEEIASAILYLTSHESSYVTGSTFTVDGGRSFY